MVSVVGVAVIVVRVVMLKYEQVLNTAFAVLSSLTVEFIPNNVFKVIRRGYYIHA